MIEMNFDQQRMERSIQVLNIDCFLAHALVFEHFILNLSAPFQPNRKQGDLLIACVCFYEKSSCPFLFTAFVPRVSFFTAFPKSSKFQRPFPVLLWTFVGVSIRSHVSMSVRRNEDGWS